eukprot:c528_g1_i1 orf=44-292(-)
MFRDTGLREPSKSAQIDFSEPGICLLIVSGRVGGALVCSYISPDCIYKKFFDSLPCGKGSPFTYFVPVVLNIRGGAVYLRRV